MVHLVADDGIYFVYNLLVCVQIEFRVIEDNDQFRVAPVQRLVYRSLDL